MQRWKFFKAWSSRQCVVCYYGLKEKGNTKYLHINGDTSKKIYRKVHTKKTPWG